MIWGPDIACRNVSGLKLYFKAFTKYKNTKYCFSRRRQVSGAWYVRPDLRVSDIEGLVWGGGGGGGGGGLIRGA